MAVDIQRIISSRIGVLLALSLLRLIPRPLGHRLANYAGDRMAAHPESLMVRTARTNQWVARGEGLDKEALDQAVRQTFRSTARSIFDLYHYMYYPSAMDRIVVLDKSMDCLMQRPEFDRRGLMVVGLHISNFDLVMHQVTRKGLRPLLLTIPDPQGGRRIEFEIRRKAGMNLMPPSFSALRQAIRHLQQGGAVMTGMDRPVPDPDVRPLFFGRPARLPTHHISLALKANVPVIMATFRKPDGKSYVYISDLIEMDHYPNRQEELLRNAEKVLRVGEGFIRQAPEQWSISLPVWPEALNETPG
jgi:KDO2-lipid IV(A) lauroyltransferase